MGPVRKNLLMPKELIKKLKKTFRSGRAESKFWSLDVSPDSSLGKKPSTLNNMLSDMLTYNKNFMNIMIIPLMR